MTEMIGYYGRESVVWWSTYTAHVCNVPANPIRGRAADWRKDLGLSCTARRERKERNAGNERRIEGGGFWRRADERAVRCDDASETATETDSVLDLDVAGGLADS
ncbi:hypothetical protein RRF57_006085 [Xylaria bambusicola]|uniref:Uncharacterized protein n=1 Tax=Xylaria bambusicola TaxID=326684 RepID=A0AAN7UDQ2_9PEZI